VKNSVTPLPFQLLLHRNRRSVANRIESYFLPFFRSWTANQRSGHCSNAVNGVKFNGKTFAPIPFSRATATVATERNYGNGTTERRNGNGSTATEWWKLGISRLSAALWAGRLCKTVGQTLYFTRKLSYRKDDRAMRPMYGFPENCRESLTTPALHYFSRNF